MDLQPVPSKLGNQLVWKEGVFDQELSPLLPRRLLKIQKLGDDVLPRAVFLQRADGVDEG